jgi:hypothetical protein
MMRFLPQYTTLPLFGPRAHRRDFLRDAAAGLGAVALAWLLNEEARGDGSAAGPHFPARARRVIQIFAVGGVSHIDTFDYKPELQKRDGQELSEKGQLDPFFGAPGRLKRSPFSFSQHGKSGLWVSSLLPDLATCVDDITFVRSMVARSSSHSPAIFQMNTGFAQSGFPSLGAWLSYGLGSIHDDLPTFVVLPDPRGLTAGGPANWGSGFLPAVHQGVPFRLEAQSQTQVAPVAELFPPAGVSAPARRAGLQFLAGLNRRFAEENPGESVLAARTRSYELAARMQVSIPEAVDFAGETEATRRLYGLDAPATAAFGRNCLLGRRLLERGVRFVQIYHGASFGTPRVNWDAHEDLEENHRKEAAVLDRPLAGLLKDLKARGMLKNTLLVWTTEFGRAPYSQGNDGKGRDHHPLAFTCWMAGAGLKPGIAFGSTDELGYNVVADPVTIYDFHATILHLLGLDHKRLTFLHNGINRRLTDVHGRVVHEILA